MLLTSRRWVPLVPTYPVSRAQLFPSECWIVKFHCCMVGAMKRSGTNGEKKKGMLPEKQGNWVESGVGAPGVPVGKAHAKLLVNPVKNEAWGVKLLSRTPTGGISPLRKLERLGIAGPAGAAPGTKGGCRVRLSMPPTSSRML